MLQEFCIKLTQLLKNKQKVCILTHYNPDGDAIGSSLAWKQFLIKLGIDAKVIVPNDFPKFLKFLPNSKEIIIAEYKKNYAEQLISNAELIFCLDFNNSSRINALENSLNESLAKKVLIDHHQSPAHFDLVYSDTSIPATCQMIFQIIEQLDKTNLIDLEIAQCIYTGIYTDTGGFRFRSTSSKTHKIAAELLEIGVKSDEIISNILDNNTPSRFFLLAKVLNTMKVWNDKKTAILYISREDMQNLGYQKGDTEGFVNYGLSISDVELSVFLIEDLKQNFIKLSFRSKSSFDVNEFAKLHFEGGGHIQASGGKSFLSIQETIEKIYTLL